MKLVAFIALDALLKAHDKIADVQTDMFEQIEKSGYELNESQIAAINEINELLNKAGSKLLEIKIE